MPFSFRLWEFGTSKLEELSYGLGFKASGLEGLGLSFCFEGPKGSDKKAY